MFPPRPEYPRPDRQRGTAEGVDWLNLNGPWQFRFDADRHGIEEKWFSPGTPDWREQIIVPFCWESLAAWGEADSASKDNYYSTRVFRNALEVTRANHRSAPRYEVGWYRRELVIPDLPPWRDKRVILTIGAADFLTDCWCNGVHLGSHEGGYTPFEFDLTDCLRAGNEGRGAWLVLRVEDPMDNSEQPVGKQWRWYTTTSGIWQTVFIEPRDPAHIKSFRIIPDIEAGTASFQVQCVNARDDCQLDVEISMPQGSPQRLHLDVRNGVATHTAKLNVVRLWDMNSPDCYDVILRLKQGERLLDTIRTYFGMRKIDFELSKETGVPTALRVNGEARFLRGALYQSYFPDGVYTATSVETLKQDIGWAKRFGFNFLRVHIKVDDPLLLYWADRLGILLMCDFPNFGEGGDTPRGRKRFESMLRDTIERDFNHPAIFAWCLFNETWGFGGQDTFADFLQAPDLARNQPVKIPAHTSHASHSSHPSAVALSAREGDRDRSAPQPNATQKQTGSAPVPSLTSQQWVQKMWELAKQLDPTRLVEDMSVVHWEHLQYYLHCDTDINSWHFYINDYEKAKAHIDKIVGSTFIGSSFNYVPGFLHKGQPLINSEYGGIGALDGDRDVSWSFKFLTNELRRHQQIAAYIYTELTDVEWEYNGFLNYDRTPKEFGYDPRIINESNALPVNSPPVQRLPPDSKVRLEVCSAHYSSRKYDNVSLCWLLTGVDTFGRIHQDLARGRLPIRFPHRKVAVAHTIELTLPSSPMLCTLLVEAQAADGVSITQNFVHYFVSQAYPPEREEWPRSLVLRGHPANWVAADWSAGAGDRDKERAEDTCYGFGHGFFEWLLPLGDADLSTARRIKILCEASAHRVDAPQTDEDYFPTTLQILLNGFRLYEAVLRNHPHDSRGVLSYWRGGVGAYGYLAHATAEGDSLQQITKSLTDRALRLRLAVPSEALAQGGLTIYGAECGRFPLCPTVIIEW